MSHIEKKTRNRRKDDNRRLHREQYGKNDLKQKYES